MAYGAPALVRGLVTQTDDMPALFTGYVAPAEAYDEGDYGEGDYSAGGGDQVALITGPVSRVLVDAFEGPSLFYGFRVRLNGQWIPDEDLDGTIEIKEAVDGAMATFSFGLVGNKYSTLRTVTTWTRTPVEVWFQNGPAGGVLDYLRIAGYVRTARQQDDVETNLRVECADAAALWAKTVTCYTAEPFSGMTRGEIVRAVVNEATDGGLVVDVEDGAIFDKPVTAINQRLFDWLRDFGEPEGWYWRVDYATGTLRAYKLDLKQAPVPADHEWGPDDIESFDLQPPADAPSLWLMRGFAIVIVDEIGISTKFTTTEIQTVYAPVIAVSQQLSDGTVNPYSAGSESASLRTTSRLVDQIASRGTTLVSQYTQEFGYKNPAAAKYHTPDDGVTPGPVDGGYDYAQAYIDENDNYVQWTKEAFILLGERFYSPHYDIDLSATGSLERTYAWVMKTMGVKTVGSATLNCLGACVGGDDQSYYSTVGTASPFRPIEEYGISQEVVIAYVRADSGAVNRETQTTWSHYAPGALVGPGTHVGRYLRYDGRGQSELVAGFKVFEIKTVSHILSEDGLVGGSVEGIQAYKANRKADGVYDWGDFKSNMAVESFQTVSKKNIAYTILTEDSYEEVVYDGTKPPVPKVVQGRLPTPRYKSSPWTTLQQNPLEYRLTDSTAAVWFGPSSEVVTNDYVTTLDEARGVVERRRRRRLADTITVKRAEANARPGETVLLVWPPAGVRQRCLIRDCAPSRQMAQADASATYVLERYR